MSALWGHLPSPGFRGSTGAHVEREALDWRVTVWHVMCREAPDGTRVQETDLFLKAPLSGGQQQGARSPSER